MPHTDTFTDRVAQFFAQRPATWIDGRELEPIGGTYAWRSRISDVRRSHGMVIENRQRTIQTPRGKVRISEYRYVPSGQAQLF